MIDDPRALVAAERGMARRPAVGPKPVMRVLGTSKGGASVLIDGADAPMTCRVLTPATAGQRCLVLLVEGAGAEAYLMGGWD